MKISRFVAVCMLLTAMVRCSTAQAGMFTTGNLAIYRVGDGQSYSNSAAAPVFVDEYTPTGTLVQSIALPTAESGSQLALTGRYGAGEIGEGLLTVSSDGRFLVLPGYSSSVGTANVASSAVSGSTNQRVIGRIDGAGNVDTSTGLGSIYSGSALVGAASTDGTSIWASGGSNGATNPGINYTTFGSGTWTNVAGQHPGPEGTHSTRGIGIWGGQMFATTTKNNSPIANITDVYQVGTGAPTVGQAAVQPLTGLPNAGGAPMAMAVFDLSDSVLGLDTLYYVDYGGDAFRKFSKQLDGTWASGGTIPAGNQDWGGLTGVIENGDVRLYATKLNNQLMTVLDTTGHNGNFSSLSPTLLATAPTGTYFRGVAFAPAAVPEPTSLALFGLACIAIGVYRRRR